MIFHYCKLFILFSILFVKDVKNQADFPFCFWKKKCLRVQYISLNPLAGVETKLFSDFLGLLVLLGCPGFLGWLVLLGCPGFFGLLAFPEASRQFFEGFYFHFYSNNQHLSNVDCNVFFEGVALLPMGGQSVRI